MTTPPATTPNLGIPLLDENALNDWRQINDQMDAVDEAVSTGYQPAGDYLTTEAGDGRYPLKTDPDPFPQYAEDADLVALATDADLAAHVAAADPHPVYLTAPEADALFLTPAEGDAAYALVGHTHPSEQSGPWRFQDTTTIANPGAGYMRCNTGVLATATILSFSRTTQDGYDIPPPGWGVVAGDTIYVQDRDDSTKWVRYEALEPLTRFPTYATGLVSVTGSAGAIVNGQICQVTFSLAGGGGGGTGGVTTDAVWDAKGDLVAGTGADAAARLAAGSNGTFLTADSAQATGLAWVVNPVTAHAALPNAHHSQAHDHTAADGSGVLTNEAHDGYSQYANLGADPTTPGTNTIRLYSKDNGSGIATLYYRTENGDIWELPTLGGGGGGSGAPSNATYITTTAENKLSQERVLGTAVIMSGALASRPAFGTAGRLYLATDANLVYRDTGSAWETFATRSTGSLATDPLADSKGDLFAASGADAVGRLALGTNGHVLTADSTQTLGVKWAAPAAGGLATDPLANAKGDVFAASGNDLIGRLALGPDGQVLTADSTQSLGVKWAAATAGAGTYLPLTGGTLSGALVAKSVTAVDPPTATTARVYGASSPAIVAAFFSGDIEVGARFRSPASGSVLTAVRWYRQGGSVTTPAAVRLWDTTATSAPVATVAGSDLAPFADGAVGWKMASLSSPVALVAGRDYVVSIGGTGIVPGYDNSYTPLPDSPLVFVGHVYTATPSTYPSTASGDSYLVDAEVTVYAVPPAAGGAVRLGNATAVAWRNAAGTADLTLSMTASDQLGLAVGSGSLTTSATGGSATALPSQPVGYLTVVLNGSVRRLPFYS